MLIPEAAAAAFAKLDHERVHGNPDGTTQDGVVVVAGVNHMSGSKTRNPSFALLSALALFVFSSAVEAQTVQNLCPPHIIADDVVVTADQRKDAGERVTPPSLIDPVNGFAWPDTPLGIVKERSGTGYLFFGSDGGCHANCGTVQERAGSITRSAGSLDNPLGSEAPSETLLTGLGLASPTDYVGAGPVYRIPDGQKGAGNLLLVYHVERATYASQYKYPDPLKFQRSFYSSLGLAMSTDEGVTWTDLGIVIRANKPYEPHAPGYDIGDGNLVVDPTNTYFYLYFPDRIERGSTDTFMSVARVPLADLLDAAYAQAPAPSFTKYYNGSWSQAGIGGRSSSILPLPYPTYAGSPSVGFNSYLNRYVAVFDDTQNISYAESPDGIHWADPVLIKATDPTQASADYAVIVSPKGDSTQLGREYYIYYTDSPNPANPKIAHAGWQGAKVRRLTVDCERGKS